MNKQAKPLEHAYTNQYEDSRNLRARMDAFESSGGPSLWEQLWKLYNFQSGQKVLEVGGGNGQFWFENRFVIPESLEVLVTDLSAGMIQEAQLRLKDTRIKLATADVHQLQFDESSFDWVLSHFMFYHLRDPAAALQQILRVLTPSGQIGIVLPLLKPGHDPLFIKWCLELAPHLEDMYRQTSIIHFGAHEFDSLARDRLVKVRGEVRPNNLVFNNYQDIYRFVSSLPLFQSDRVNEVFWKELEQYSSRYIAEHGSIIEETELSLQVYARK